MNFTLHMRGVFSKSRRIISVLTAAFFTFTNILSAQGPADFSLASNTPVPIEIPDRITIPDDLGTIQEEHRNGSGSPFIVFIQDAHVVVDAQVNIEELIRHVGKEYGIRLVALEGGKGRLDPTLFRAFPEAGVKKRVMEGYRERGEVTGAEMASMFGEREGIYYGIEDWDLYERNYVAYLRASQRREKVLEELGEIREGLDRKRRRVYGRELNEFHDKVEGFREERVHLLELLKYLKGKIQYSGSQSPNAGSRVQVRAGGVVPASQVLNPLSGFRYRETELEKLFASIERDEAVSAGEMEGEIRELAEGLRKRHETGIKKEELMEFNGKYQDYMTGNLDAASYLKYLIQVGEKVGEKVRLSGLMQELLGHQETLSTIRGTRVFEELEALIQEMEERMMRSEEERKIAEKYTKVRVVRDLTKLELTRGQLEKYQKDRDGYRGLLKDGRWLDGAEEFYRLAVARDEALQRNLEALLKREKEKAAVVLAGGFHSEGFARGLKEKGYSYVVVTPRIRSLRGHERYEEVMMGKLSYKEYLEESFYDAFVRHSTMKMVSELDGPEFRKVLKEWRDNVIRKLAEEGRVVESGEYTKYIDFLVKVYVEKYGVGGLTNKTKEEILKDIGEELKGFQEGMLARIRERFEDQLGRFMEGIRGLIGRDELTEENLETLIENVGKKPGTLQAARLILGPDVSVRDQRMFVDVALNRFRELREADGDAPFENVAARSILEGAIDFLQKTTPRPEDAGRVEAGAAQVRPDIQQYLATAERLREQVTRDVKQQVQPTPELLGEITNRFAERTGLKGNAGKAATLIALRQELTAQEKPTATAPGTRQNAAALGQGAALGTAGGGLCVTGDTILPVIRTGGEESQNSKIRNQNLEELKLSEGEVLWSLKRNEREKKKEPLNVGASPHAPPVTELPIVEVKPGDFVLSLDEATQKIEPHRILALLDMGKKPVYKLTTSAGRSIKTTANHPYLVKSQGARVKLEGGRGQWIKVSELRVGDEIAVPNKEGLPLAISDEFLPGEFDILKDFSEETSPDVLAFVHGDDRRAAIGMAKILMASLLACLLKSKFHEDANDLGGLERSQSVQQATLISWSPTNLRGLGAFFSTEIQSWIASLILRRSSSILLACVWQPRNAGTEATNLPSSSSSIRTKYSTFRISKPLGANISMMPDQSQETGNFLHIFRLFFLSQAYASDVSSVEALASHILWEPIISIEPVGHQQVYDIEVEGTHNFIGNGIFAHNTAFTAGAAALGEKAVPAAAWETISGWVSALSLLSQRLSRITARGDGGIAPSQIAQEWQVPLGQLQLQLSSHLSPSLSGTTRTPKTIKMRPDDIAAILSVVERLNASLTSPDEMNTTDKLSAQPEIAPLLLEVKNLLSVIKQTLTQRLQGVNTQISGSVAAALQELRGAPETVAESAPAADAAQRETSGQSLGGLYEKTLVQGRLDGQVATLPGEVRNASEFTESLVSQYRNRIGFTTFSGKGVSAEDVDRAKDEIRRVLSQYSPADTVVISGSTNVGGVALVYDVAEEMGFKTAGIVALEGLREETGNIRVTEHLYVEGEVEGDTYRAANNYAAGKDKGGWGSESPVFLDVLTKLVAFGGGAQAKTEIEKTLDAGKTVEGIFGIRNKKGQLGETDGLKDRIEGQSLGRALGAPRLRVVSVEDNPLGALRGAEGKALSTDLVRIGKEAQDPADAIGKELKRRFTLYFDPLERQMKADFSKIPQNLDKAENMVSTVFSPEWAEELGNILRASIDNGLIKEKDISDLIQAVRGAVVEEYVTAIEVGVNQLMRRVDSGVRDRFAGRLGKTIVQYASRARFDADREVLAIRNPAKDVMPVVVKVLAQFAPRIERLVMLLKKSEGLNRKNWSGFSQLSPQIFDEASRKKAVAQILQNALGKKPLFSFTEEAGFGSVIEGFNSIVANINQLSGDVKLQEIAYGAAVLLLFRLNELAKSNPRRFQALKGDKTGVLLNKFIEDDPSIGFLANRGFGFNADGSLSLDTSRFLSSLTAEAAEKRAVARAA